jgi:hypothetical protein
VMDCQARGCNGIALPWPVIIPQEPRELEVFLCRRCELEIHAAETTPRLHAVEVES